jgi:2'-5' RNA ligase
MPESEPPRTQRLFFALWPDQEIRKHLCALADDALPQGVGRRVQAENLHLTLAFLGSVEAKMRHCIEEVASDIRARRFTLTFERLGCWQRTGVMWVGPLQQPEDLIFLVDTLNSALAGCGMSTEKRAYQAHLTLARKVRRCRRGHAIAPIVWDVNRFCLVASRTYAEGARYEILRSWELG